MSTKIKFLQKGGEMGALTRAYDWNVTAIGNPESWSQSHLTSVNMMLTSRFPMLVFWGKELITFYNDAFRPSLGNDGKHPGSLGQPGHISWAESWPVIGPMIHDIMQGGDAVWFEDQKLPLYRDGKMGYAYWTYSFSPLLDDDGSVGGVLVTCSETTKAVESTAKVAASEARFRGLVQQAPVAIFVLHGKEMIFEAANDLMLKMIGKDNSVLGKPYNEAIPEIKGQPFEALLDQVYTSGKKFTSGEMLAKLEHKGELTEGYYKFTYQPVTSSEGQTEGIICVAVDVTEQVNARKAAEKHATELTVLANTLRQSEQRLQSMLDTMAEGVVIVDTAGKPTYVNPMAQKIMGVNEAGFTNRDYNDSKWQNFRLDGSILPAEDHPVYVVLHTGLAISDQEVAIMLPSGEKIYISINAAPLTDEKGNITGGIATFSDVTHRRMLSQQKDDFISVASHELKTPVTSLKASLQVLSRMKENTSPEMRQRFIVQANKSLDKLSGLISELLDTNRISQGQLRLNKSTFTIAGTIHDCCDHIRVTGTHQVILTGNADQQVYADERKIDQVLVNFVNNAVKYAPESKEIVIAVERLAGSLKVSVTDQGPGIPAEKKRHLFERYYRADYSGVQFSGLGLGLFISAEIIKKHGGEIGVESELGKGSTFWFTLPVVG